MTPPPTAALAMLCLWALVVFWATSTARAPADDRFDRNGFDPGFDSSADDAAPDASFSAADD